jgi:hypothetical protein
MEETKRLLIVFIIWRFESLIHVLQVGGMMCGMLTDMELESLRETRHLSLKAAMVQRGGLIQHWSNGEMRVVGSRFPSGGRPGDTYTVYPRMDVKNDVNKVERLFKYAQVTPLYVIMEIKLKVYSRASKWFLPKLLLIPHRFSTI